ncbi:LysM peptidoglycan-binding domain-containing protein [Pseudomonas putida]|uniref:LysM peptidoglycan-binding domain-containing protein n=1 Tax=Pseudomonas putida TaxID=303 RepID=A0A7W2L109_PSEPU|nr:MULTISPECIES: FimV/HubP family polar landmark protein [Pseudomonas]MBA6116539.1 LysM peptidoglycan-binding domain-containing protein [Pseudomonas putida]MBI6941119.1 LysM peptidoglycan-binding domain-containing protein [Pseudomonas putida]MBI6957490.1 LysM peptidoglycan-binding domain-containing protein [Pseudomonas putida]PZQ38578.1 MAG: peptidoglycan-binding protein [Pseudomonas putida]QNL89080.1 Tfp pilus assembly protein FimV [Pseudomonas putida]
MLRIRKLVLAMAAASALSSGMANALGLGELTLKSAQNQPLDAEIELLDVRDLTAAEVAPSLAPPEEFSKAGVAYPTYLEDLTFTPVINPNGRSVLRVTSSQPLPGTVVKFLVQVMWPQGRLLRDYSVLLDQAKAQGQQPAAANVAPAVSSAGSYTTKRRDTLWQIAARNTQGGGSVQQTMIAIQALNPDAFIGNNINQLKVGQVLRLPDQQQIQSIPQGEANREVAEQYAAWREGRRLGPRARQLDATRRGAADAAPERIAQGDNLRLVSPGNQAGAGTAKAINDKLAVAQESLDTSRRDNEELKSRMSDLQSQLDKLQRLIQLKNDQLARLEAQGAEGATPPAALPGEPAQPAADAQAAPAEPVVQPAPAAVDTAPEAAPANEPAPAAEQPGALDQVLGNPLLLGLIAGSAFLVLLLLLLLLARKRKAQQEAEKHLRMARALAEESAPGPDLDLPPSSFDELEVASPTVTLSPAVVAASAAAAVAAEKPTTPTPAAPVAEPAPVQDPNAELLAEVEQSLARGRLNHAADLLETAVAAQPEHDGLRLKLMEVYARQGDHSAFVEQERKLPGNDDNIAQVNGLKERYPAMLGLAAAGLGAAALAAELDQQYVHDLLQDAPQDPAAVESEADPAVQAVVEPEPEAASDPEPEVAPEPVIEPAADEAGEASVLDDNDFDSAFDLSLGDDLPLDDTLEPPVLDEAALAELQEDAEPVAPAAESPTDADDDFETLLAQAHAEPQNVDDLADFDLDIAEPTAADAVDEPPVDVAAELAAFDAIPEFDPISELELPEDFDLSLSLDDESPAAKSFASELNDVNAELDKLSQSLESPSLEPHFTAADAAQEPEPLDDLDFDFFSGSDEVATKLDLARAYIDMGDHQGARDILDEVVKDGDDTQRQEAEDMLSRLI